MGSSASVINKKINESKYLIIPLKKEDKKEHDKVKEYKEHIVVSSYGNKFNYNDEFQKYQYR